MLQSKLFAPASLSPVDKAHIALIVVSFAAILAIDVLTALGLAAGALYAPLVLYSSLLQRPQFTIWLGAFALFAIGLGFIASAPSPAGFPILYVWINRVISAVVVGITTWLVVDRTRASVQLQANNQRLRVISRELTEQQQLLEAASAVGGLGGWAFDLVSGKVAWSDDVAEMHGAPHGFSPDSIDAALDFFIESDRTYVKTAFHTARVEGRPVEVDAQINTLDGRRVWVRAVGKPVLNADGRVVRIEGALQDITARKMADQVVRVSLQRFQQLAESMPIIVWTATTDGRVDYVTPLFFDYAGIPGRSMAVDQWINFVHTEDKERVVQVWSRCLESGERYEVEMRLRRGDGVYRWHLARALQVNEASGTKWFGSLTDVHDQKETLQKVSRLAGQLAATLERITDAFYTLDANWNFTYINRQAERLLKRTRDELMGKCVWVEFAPTLGTLIDTEYRRAMAEQKSVVFEQFYAPLEIWFEVHAYPSPEGLTVFFQDISARRAAQEQVRLLQLAVSRLTDVVIITEADPLSEPGPRIVFVNDAFVTRLGYSRDEVIGRSPRFLQGPGTQRRELERIRNALVKREPVRVELLNYTKAGDEVWFEVDIVPVIDDTGVCSHFVAVERDINSRKLLESRLRQIQRMDAIGQLTSGVAHDFNNLLTVILGNAEILAELVQGQPTLLERARSIADAGQQGAELTRRLLAFAREQPLDPQPVDANKVIGSMQPLLERALGEHITLRITPADGLWQAMADASQLENAVLNLALNARDAMPDGGTLTVETGNIWFSNEFVQRQPDMAAGEYVMVAVSDEGMGIPGHIRDRIFEPFFTTKAGGQGTGLGLPMVYGFIKQSGGHIDIDSTPGKGTTIKMFLPRVTPSGEISLLAQEG
ncbi:MAG: PAS domain S-box protein [Pusillimonas sp.]